MLDVRVKLGALIDAVRMEIKESVADEVLASYADSAAAEVQVAVPKSTLEKIGDNDDWVFHQTGTAADLSKREYVFRIDVPRDFDYGCKDSIDILIKSAMRDYMVWELSKSHDEKELSNSQRLGEFRRSISRLLAREINPVFSLMKKR
ncbi:MAG: hypothetical protein LBB27_02990 [Tannerellaceae bacterium]|jgi:hypothetical protein|nr:hypothetical protein [Tannerellaceae bacterium]